MLMHLEITFFLGILLVIKTQSAHNKLDVEVLFESLCPDSLHFIRDQLYPNWKELSPYIDLKLVPFGKSKSYENGTKFVCQHGSAECRGNRMLSCALETVENQYQQVEFTNCFMNNFITNREEELTVAVQCSEELSLNKDSIIDCYNTEVGTILQLDAEQSTARILPKFIPTILYGMKFIQKLQNGSIIDFKGVVCELVDKPADICDQISTQYFATSK